ncbi:MAG TPA: HNH endonuclease signature motif containing protein, partial [Acidimicrobiales bacterium]|nr:HNH endonuclease signature motif containing protein [Acidimicrobiales bacterium]
AEAADTLKTSRNLGAAPGTEEALRAGVLSEQQAAAITAAAKADPSSEQSLLEESKRTNVEQLRRRSRQVQAAAKPDDEHAAQARIHDSRYLRTWSNPEGAFHGSFRLTAAAGAKVKAVLDAIGEDLFKHARAAGRRERADALAADALTALAAMAAAAGAPSEGAAGESTVSTGGTERGIRPTMFVRVDLAALARGHTMPGEHCSIDGLGPIPVWIARSMWAQATLAALLTDGERIIDLRLAGRAMPRALRLAVIARDPSCVVPRCGRTTNLEFHHLEAVADGGDTFLDNLARICPWHHDEITYHGATLTGPPGHWHYEPPPYGRPGDPEGGPFDDDYLDVHPGHPPPRAA